MEELKHECGVAMIRLLKPLEYYEKKYGTWMYGLNKLYLLMEKQHNRGQEGAGLACVKLQANPGEEYMFRERALGTSAITEIFEAVHSNYASLTETQLHNAEYAEQVLPFAGEIYMGHLRYSTTGKSGISYIHPFLRRNNWRAKNLSLCGNFNLTNVDEIFEKITAKGQHPRKYADTYIMLEEVGHRLDREVERLYAKCENEGLEGMDITYAIEDQIDLANVLKKTTPGWDGGYVICGITGSGECFSIRDPWGIRPAFWYADDEVVVLASERPVIQTAFNLSSDSIKELLPGQALFVNKKGNIRTEQINSPKKNNACSFERIYFFSRQRQRYLPGTQAIRKKSGKTVTRCNKKRRRSHGLFFHPQYCGSCILRHAGRLRSVPEPTKKEISYNVKKRSVGTGTRTHIIDAHPIRKSCY